MKKILLIVFVLFSNSSFAGDIRYGYNAMGDYVPTSIGDTDF